HNTYLAVAQAVSALLSKSVARIVLARPAVEAGEKLGFLPGDLQEKVDPYLRPLYDALYDLLDYEKVARPLVRSASEVAPIAFMRGRTLNDAFVIIDEAQNTTTEQMKMVLTRIGFGSKVVVTGDITQIDLPQGKVSGLVDAISVLNGVEGISSVYFDEKDVVRQKLVQGEPPVVVSFAGPCAGHVLPPAAESARRIHCEACERRAAGLGDIVVSVDTAERNARRLGRTLQRELDVLALHGFLHVLGYDHETDDGTMDRLERRLRRELL